MLHSRYEDGKRIEMICPLSNLIMRGYYGERGIKHFLLDFPGCIRSFTSVWLVTREVILTT